MLVVDDEERFVLAECSSSTISVSISSITRFSLISGAERCCCWTSPDDSDLELNSAAILLVSPANVPHSSNRSRNLLLS